MKTGVTTEQAAKAAGITRQTVQDWIRRRKIKPPKLTYLIGGLSVRLWDRGDIARLLRVKAKVFRKGRGRKPKSA